MLPGFRFLFAAIVLSMAILVFGLGAAALLRAAHEEFASNPSWHAAPEPMFAQQPEATRPVLAMLRVEPPEQKAPDNVPAVAAPAEPATIVSPAAEPERIDALKPEDSSLSEPAKPEIPVSESPAQSEATPAAADAPADETKIVATIAPTEEASSPAKEVTATLAEQASPANSPDADIASPPNSPGADIASTKIAALGGPPVAVEAPAKAAGAKPDRSVVKKRLQARRAAQRRKIALRARLAQQTLQQQQSINPFAQPAIR